VWLPHVHSVSVHVQRSFSTKQAALPVIVDGAKNVTPISMPRHSAKSSIEYLLAPIQHAGNGYFINVMYLYNKI